MSGNGAARSPARPRVLSLRLCLPLLGTHLHLFLLPIAPLREIRDAEHDTENQKHHVERHALPSSLIYLFDNRPTHRFNVAPFSIVPGTAPASPERESPRGVPGRYRTRAETRATRELFWRFPPRAGVSVRGAIRRESAAPGPRSSRTGRFES